MIFGVRYVRLIQKRPLNTDRAQLHVIRVLRIAISLSTFAPMFTKRRVIDFCRVNTSAC